MRSTVRCLAKRSTCCLLCFAGSVLPVLAQTTGESGGGAAPAPPGPGLGRNYVFDAILVSGLIIAALGAVCRSSQRV